MRHLIIATLIGVAAGSLASANAGAAALEIRNVRLVDTGRITNITGTVVNISDHAVSGACVDLAVQKANQVVDTVTVKVPPLDPGQAWPIWEPVAPEGGAAVVIRARDPQTSVSAVLSTNDKTMAAK